MLLQTMSDGMHAMLIESNDTLDIVKRMSDKITSICVNENSALNIFSNFPSHIKTIYIDCNSEEDFLKIANIIPIELCRKKQFELVKVLNGSVTIHTVMGIENNTNILNHRKLVGTKNQYILDGQKTSTATISNDVNQEQVSDDITLHTESISLQKKELLNLFETSKLLESDKKFTLAALNDTNNFITESNSQSEGKILNDRAKLNFDGLS